jgi:hypothetical protein
MSDDLRFAAPDDLSFQWPATERRTRPAPAREVKRWPITRHQRDNLARLRRAQDVARRWEAGDEDVTMRDLIDLLLR